MKTTLCVVAFLLLNQFCSYAQDASGPANPADTTRSVSTSTQGIRQKADSGIHPTVVAPWFIERFKISAGFLIPLSNTSIEVSNRNGDAGTSIDFEEDLGLKRGTETFSADFQWRASRRSRFDLSFYRLNRSVTHTIDKDIHYSDSTYRANATLNGFFNTDIYRFSYGYALFAKPKYELGVMIGAHVVRANVGVGLYTPNTSVTRTDDFGVTAPLPNFGIWGGYVFNDRWALNGEIDWLSLTVGDIQGRILAYNISFIYKILNNLTASAGYTGLNCRVDVTKTDRTGTLKWGNNGPALTVAFSFGRRPWVH